MKLLTEHEADKTKDVFVGMWRPPYPEVLQLHKGVTIGKFPGSSALRESYLTGDFDEPLYRRILDA